MAYFLQRKCSTASWVRLSISSTPVSQRVTVMRDTSRRSASSAWVMSSFFRIARSCSADISTPVRRVWISAVTTVTRRNHSKSFSAGCRRRFVHGMAVGVGLSLPSAAKVHPVSVILPAFIRDISDLISKSFQSFRQRHIRNLQYKHCSVVLHTCQVLFVAVRYIELTA